jgi:hypothetical protein
MDSRASHNRTISLKHLIREQLESNPSNSDWYFSDYTRGHLILVVILMLISYLFQVIGFCCLLMGISKPLPSEVRPSFTVEPYLKCAEISILLLLVHFQFYAFWHYPITILEIVSRKLNYTNITMTILYAGVITSFYWEDNELINLIRMVASFCILCLSFFIYYHMRNEVLEHSHCSWTQIAGFNILYSLSLPFFILETANYSLVVIMDDSSIYYSPSSSIITFMGLYCVAATAALLGLKDVYIGLGVALNTFGIFLLQKLNICVDKHKHCSEKVQAFSLIFSCTTFFMTLITFYFYPTAYKYQSSKLKILSEISS